jgi:hypothetical protein
VKKRWSVAAVIVFFIFLFSHNPVGAFNDESTLYLAQATQEASDEQSETAKDDASESAEEDEEDEYDDEYDDEDEYAYVQNRNKLIAE